MKFASNAEEIRYYTKKLLEDNKEHTVQEIKDYILLNTGKKFSDGTYSGAFRDLIAKEKLEILEPYLPENPVQYILKKTEEEMNRRWN